MNRRQQIRLTPQEQAEFLDKEQKGALATIDQHGFPHLVAMSFFAKDGALYMTSYAKAQKVVNIRRNPKVAFMVESGKTYATVRGVMIRGHCELIDDPAVVEATLREIVAHRTGPATTPASPAVLRPEARSKRVVIKIIPERVASWDHAKLGGRY